MKLKPVFITAPSRSGSSLLVRMLNCTSNMVVVNEPLDSANIMDRSNIETLFGGIENNLKHGFVIQRTDNIGLEVTDTFPPSKMQWTALSRSSEGIEVVGIKKAFPAFSNKDFFQLFVRDWSKFVQWMGKEMNGATVAIVRDPRFTILSWKTTFEALKEETERQCSAWNLIVNTLIASQKYGLKIIRYEDLIQNPVSVIEAIANHIEIKAGFGEPLPEVKRFELEDYLNSKGVPVGATEEYFRLVESLCGKTAQKLGYLKMHT